MTNDLVVRVLKDLAERTDPRAEVQQTAKRFNLPVTTVKEMVAKHGWPNAGAMGRAATVIERNLQAGAPAAKPARPAGTVTVSDTPTVVQQVTRSLRLADLVPHPSNVPGRVSNVAELALAIEQVGLLQPLVVTEHPNQRGWLILAGHRRWTALKQLGRTHAECIIREGNGGDLDKQLFVMLIENIHRQDLTAMEKAYAFGDLRDRRKMTLQQISERAGVSPGTVSYYLSLLDLDATTQARVQTGEVQVTQAIEAVKEVRRKTRRAAGGKPVGRPVVLEGAWLNKRHMLARKVAEACTHGTRPRIGEVGCGQCWEDAIRADERLTNEAVG